VATDNRRYRNVAPPTEWHGLSRQEPLGCVAPPWRVAPVTQERRKARHRLAHFGLFVVMPESDLRFIFFCCCGWPRRMPPCRAREGRGAIGGQGLPGRDRHFSDNAAYRAETCHFSPTATSRSSGFAPPEHSGARSRRDVSQGCGAEYCNCAESNSTTAGSVLH